MAVQKLEGSLRHLFDEEHDQFRTSVRKFLERHAVPHLAEWNQQGQIGRDLWKAAGEAGLLGFAVPQELGGGGVSDYRFRCVVAEEIAGINSASLQSSFALQDDVFLPYLINLGTAQQQERWLPGSCRGDLIGAVAMTEPGAGSDLRGIRTQAVFDGHYWVLHGSKTFITNGILSDLVIVFARTEGGDGEGFSLFVVERDTPGFTRGPKLEKVGMRAQDTAELFFENCRVPADHLLGTVGGGFGHLGDHLPLERLSLAVSSISIARAALSWTVRHVQDRKAFGKPLADQQTIQFSLAEMLTEIDVTQAFVDDAVRAYNAAELTSSDAAKAKWWSTELQKRVIDRCVQLHGGYGYMLEYPIAQAYLDARVQTIYGGTTEIMKLLIGREMTSA